MDEKTRRLIEHYEKLREFSGYHLSVFGDAAFPTINGKLIRICNKGTIANLPFIQNEWREISIEDKDWFLEILRSDGDMRRFLLSLTDPVNHRGKLGHSCENPSLCGSHNPKGIYSVVVLRRREK